jgi:hypothetical protein
MRSALVGLALLGAAVMGTPAKADTLPPGQSLIQPVYWDGTYCGPRCQEHRWWQQQRREARRHQWREHQWDRPGYGYYAQPRTYGYYAPRY